MKKVSRVFLIAVIAILSLNIASAQEKDNFTIDKLSIEGRADFDYFEQGETSTSGIDGKYFNFEIKGTFLQDFSYRVRQRFDMYYGSSKTDYMIVTYQGHKNLSVTAGKMPLAVGGWEYDLAPIDVYYASQFWNTFNCYDVGGQVAFHSNNKKHDIIFQITNSTFYENEENYKFEGKYAYNLLWYGRMGFFKTSYSFNMIEQTKHHYINYIALGNMFDFDRLDFYIDFMNRGFFHQKDFFLGDFTLIGEVKYAFTDKFTLVAKGGYDRNINDIYGKSQFMDMTVVPGMEYTFAGLGFEAYPYKGNKNVRLHGFFAANKSDDLGLSLQFNVGVTWRVNFVK